MDTGVDGVVILEQGEVISELEKLADQGHPHWTGNVIAHIIDSYEALSDITDIGDDIWYEMWEKGNDEWASP